MIRRLVKAFCACTTLFAISLSVWATVELYQDELVGGNKGVEPTDAAIIDSFKRVLIRVTADFDVTQQEGIAAQVSKARDYVNRVENQDKSVTVSFNSTLVQELLQKNGYTIWANRRPNVLVWGVKEVDNHLRFVTHEYESSFLSALSDTAERLGVNLIFPLLDLEDSVNVGVNDVWGQFPSSLWGGSARYAPDAILIHKWQKDGEQWESEWNLMLNDEDIKFDFKGGDPEQVAKAGLLTVSKALLDLYGVAPRKGKKPFEVAIRGIGSTHDFAQIQHLLNQLDSVHQVRLKQIQRDQATFEVQSQVSNKAALIRHLNLNRHLTQLAQNSEDDKLFFQWTQ